MRCQVKVEKTCDFFQKSVLLNLKSPSNIGIQRGFGKLIIKIHDSFIKIMLKKQSQK